MEVVSWILPLSEADARIDDEYVRMLFRKSFLAVSMTCKLRLQLVKFVSEFHLIFELSGNPGFIVT